MPVFNGEEFLEEAIQSILKQTLPNFELLIVDDASTDDSSQIISSYAQQDSRIKVITNSVNHGLVAARNRILGSAEGSYLAWNDQDDISLPNRLETQLQFFKYNPDVAVCGSWTWVGTSLINCKLLRLPQKWEEMKAFVPFYNPLSFNTTVFNLNELRGRNPRFPEKAGLALDYDLWSRLITSFEFRNIPTVTGLYRTHANQNSRGRGSAEISHAALEIQSQFLNTIFGVHLNDHEREIHATITSVPVILSPDISLMVVERYLCWLLELGSTSSTIKSAPWRRTVGFTWGRILKAFLTSKERDPQNSSLIIASPLTRLLPEAVVQRVMWSAVHGN